MLKKITIYLLLQSILLLLCVPFLCFSQETDTITSSSSLIDPNTIQSPGRIFQLGFFSPPHSTNRYLAVFYTVSNETVIWVGNRDRPLNDSSGNATIAPDGNLVLRNGLNEIIWSTNVTGNTTSRTTSAQIQDTGNLRLRDASTGNTIWESFMHPSSVSVPTMRLIENTNTNKKVVLSSWRSPSDPAAGNFTNGLETTNLLPQLITRNSGRAYWRSGPWNGQTLIGILDAYSPTYTLYTVVNDSSGMFYFTMLPQSILMKINLNSSGSIIQTLWNHQTRNWDVIWLAPRNECEIYGRCGPFGKCNLDDSPICSCLRGFEPEDREEWDSGNWTGGCVRRRQLQCSRNNYREDGNGDRFVMLPFTKLPDSPIPFASRGVEECWSRCLGNCSCVAYALESNIGCMLWSDSLIDIQTFANVGHDLYIRVEASELDHNEKDYKKIIIIVVAVVGVVVSICGYLYWKRVTKRRGNTWIKNTLNKATHAVCRLVCFSGISEERSTSKTEKASMDTSVQDALSRVNLLEFPLFKIEVLSNATNNFSEDNKLGKGGFGDVYKGELPNAREIAVKRLSKVSGQGLQEFMNEVELISKLQHKNLVRLLGCCVENIEKMLIYEYMPNKSLDFHLFDPSEETLDWRKRFNIIEGICRGLLYLHRDSRLKIIHRDLKPSNVLLDYDWIPKISDFGMARIYGTNQDDISTVRVVGTYGYMAPEYAVEGRFSEKTDVFSFGVMMLEICTGRKNTSFFHGDQCSSINLLGHVWQLWNEDDVTVLMDPRISNQSNRTEVRRCMHIGLLCVQQLPKDRPSISSVLSMLSSETVELSKPKQPAFYTKSRWSDTGTSSTQQSQKSSSSMNNLTITKLDGR